MTKKSNKKILISVSSFDDALLRVKSTIRSIEAGAPMLEPVHRLSFISESAFLKNLTPKRLELLRFLRKQGPLSCRKLSIELNRAYANVHEDVQALLRLKLIKKNAEQKLFIPWDEITISLKLAA